MVFFTVLGVIVVNAPGWERVKSSFLDWDNFVESAPGIIAKFWVNVALFLIAEVLILVFGLVLAVMRSLPGPVLFPLRLLATIYVDLFRALPGVLVIYRPRLRHPRPAPAGRAERPVLLGRRRADAPVLRLRVRGLPGRDRFGPSQPGGRRPLARHDPRSRRCGTSSCRRPCAG